MSGARRRPCRGEQITVLLRNVDADLTLNPREWPFGALVTVITRGLIMNKARSAREERDRQAVATQVREAISRSGETQQQFATNIGTSASRLSTYANGSVIPSAAMSLRILDESLQD